MVLLGRRKLRSLKILLGWQVLPENLEVFCSGLRPRTVADDKDRGRLCSSDAVADLDEATVRLIRSNDVPRDSLCSVHRRLVDLRRSLYGNCTTSNHIVYDLSSRNSRISVRVFQILAPYEHFGRDDPDFSLGKCPSNSKCNYLPYNQQTNSPTSFPNSPQSDDEHRTTKSLADGDTDHQRCEAEEEGRRNDNRHGSRTQPPQSLS